MKVTEVLITGYHNGVPICAVNLETGTAKVALTSKDEYGETIVAAAWEQSTQIFTSVRDTLQELTIIPVR